MARKKKLINNTSIPQREIEIIARCIFPDILAFYESEEGQREFAEQNGKRNRQKSQIKKLQHKPLSKYRNKQVNPPIWGLPCLFFTCLPFSFAILAVWIQGALSRRSGNRCFRIARNKQIIRTRPPQGRTGSDYMGLVREAGLEPARP